MQVTETLNEGLKHEFKISVPAADLDAKADAKLVDLKDKVRLNGPFRPGQGAGQPPERRSMGRSVTGRGRSTRTIPRHQHARLFTEARCFKLAGRAEDHDAEPRQTEVEELLSGKSDLNLHGGDRGRFRRSSSADLQELPAVEEAGSPDRPATPDIDGSDPRRIADGNRSYAAKNEGAQRREKDDPRHHQLQGQLSTARRSTAATGEGIQVVIGRGPSSFRVFEEQAHWQWAPARTRTFEGVIPQGTYAAPNLGRPGRPSSRTTANRDRGAAGRPRSTTSSQNSSASSRSTSWKEAAREAGLARGIRPARRAQRPQAQPCLIALDESHKFEAPPVR